VESGSTGEANLRKEGSFPIFIKEEILPMWDARKGASFEAIQGLYEMSIQIQRTKMKALRNVDKELYGPRQKLAGKQLEARMKASKEARRTHHIMKWTALINDVLLWRSSYLTGQEVEKEINDGNEPAEVYAHKATCEKKKASLAKYMKNLSACRSLRSRRRRVKGKRRPTCRRRCCPPRRHPHRFER
jgi:hypothetical protein